MKSRGLNTAPWWAPTLMLNSSLNWPFTCTQHLAFSYTALTAYVALAQLSYPSSIDHLLRLCAWSLSLFHLTWMRFSRSTHLLMFLSLETLTSTMRTGLPILVELIDLVLWFLYIILNDFTQMVNFPTRIPDILIVLLFKIYPFLVMLVFVIQWLSNHWKILIMLLSQFPLTSIKFTTGCPISSHRLWLFLCWLGWSSWSFERCSMEGCL